MNQGTKTTKPAPKTFLLGLLLVWWPTVLSAQTISDSQNTASEVAKLIKLNSLVVTSLDLNSADYPFDGVSPQFSFYSDPDSGILRKVKSYRAYSMIGENFEAIYNTQGIRTYVYFSRRRTGVETLSNGKTQLSEELLSEYRIYTFGETVLKMFVRSSDAEGKISDMETSSIANSEAKAILESEKKLSDFYHTQLVLLRD